MQARGRRVDLVFVDMGRVEPQNIGRQNFAPVEVGQFKAQTLMLRFNRAFGLSIRARCVPFAPEMIGTERYGLVIGAVDDAPARREIAGAVKQRGSSAWWRLDCGNHEHSGQVLLGNRHDLRAPDFALGACVGLPLPSVLPPELLEAASQRMANFVCTESAGQRGEGMQRAARSWRRGMCRV